MKSSQLFSVFVVLLIGTQTSWAGVENFSNKLSLSVPVEEELVKDFVEQIPEIRKWLLQTIAWRTGPAPRAINVCVTCRTALILALNLINSGSPPEQVGASIVTLCKNLNIVAPDVCEGVVDMYLEPAMYIYAQRPTLTAVDICAFVLSADGSCGSVNANMTNWDVNVDANKKPLIAYPRLPSGTPTVKVIQLTDIHPDLHYAEGSLTDCGKPLCCRASDDDQPINASLAAGPWGDYLCDMPEKAMVNLFQDVASRHPDAEFVLMTGDLVHHQIWNTTVEDNIDHFDSVSRAIFAAFPDKPIYPVIGNHEPHPCNMFPTSDQWDSGHDISWVYNNLADAYSSHLTPEALVTFRRAGYYTILHKPGFRIIVINSNFCYLNNFWILHTSADPEGQLQWLSDRLLDAERAKEKVWIVGHVPPGSDDCWPVWSNKFLAIINRFESLIQAQFYGHTHNDDFRVFFDSSANPPRPTGSLYIGASTTAYTDLNPGYKVFFADGVHPTNASWEIFDHETWIYNLTQANAATGSADPTWFKLYSAKESYGLPSLRPADLYDFVVRMVTDEALFQRFYLHYHKDSDTIHPCDELCKMDYLCAIVSSDYTSNHCDRLHAVLSNSREIYGPGVVAS